MTTSDIREINELDLLNLFLNLLKEVPHFGVDNVLKKSGYSLFSIEKDVRTDEGTIKFDICLRNSDEFLGVELKGGRYNNDTDQIQKYKTFNKKQYLRNETVNDIETINFHVHIVFNKRYNRDFEADDDHLVYSIFKIADCYIKFECNSMIMNFINENKEKVNLDNVQKIIRFDKETKREDLAILICTEVDACLLANEPFTIDDIYIRAYCSIPEVADTIGSDIKSFANKKIKELLRKMESSSYKDLIKWENKTWIPVRQASVSEIKRARKVFLEVLKNPKTPIDTKQLDMFDFMDDEQADS